MLSNKRLLITGASSGIGKQICITCNQLNAETLIIGRNLHALEDTKNCCLNPQKVYIQFADLQDNSQFNEIRDTLHQNGLNGIVHSAGVSHTLPLKLHTYKHFENTFSINLIGGLKLISILEDALLPSSSIVFISSVMGIAGQAAKHSYCASKGAVDAAIRSLALEFAPKQIRVNSILPGVIKSPLANLLFSKLPQDVMSEIASKHPLGLGLTSDVANIAIFLLSDLSAHITGQNIVVDGGYTAQ